MLTRAQQRAVRYCTACSGVGKVFTNAPFVSSTGWRMPFSFSRLYDTTSTVRPVARLPAAAMPSTRPRLLLFSSELLQ